MSLELREVERYVPNRNRGGRMVRFHVASIGEVSCTARTAKAAKDALAAALAAWHGAGHDDPTVVVSGSVVGILTKRPLYYVDPDADPSAIEWRYVIAGSGCVTVMGGTFEHALDSLRRHVESRAATD